MPDVEQHEGSPRRGLTPPRRPRPLSKFYSKLHNFTAEETSQRGRDKGTKRTRKRRQPPEEEEEEEEKEKEDEVKGKQRLGFSIKLSDNEMMQDFLAFKGTVPLRKPSKKVQKMADPLFPGLELSKITLSKYKVHE